MKLKNISTKGLYECTKCGRHFYDEEAGIKDTILYGKNIPVRCCPYCNTHEIEYVRDQRRLEKFRYIDIKKEQYNNDKN